MKHTYTHKTRNGRKARILATDLLGDTPVVVALLDEDHTECVVLYNTDLTCCGYTSALDLVEYSPWKDVAVDTKVFVKDFENEEWTPRHFSHFEQDAVFVFTDGATSFTGSSEETVSWRFVKLAE